jgi:LCP family protein required for cell wall assembly
MSGDDRVDSWDSASGGQDLPGPRPGYYPAPPGSAGTVGTRHAARPGLAQQQLTARVSATRKARRQRAVIVVCTLLSVAVLLVATGTWALTSYINGHVDRVSAGTAGAPSTGPLNILVAGVDRRTGLTRQQQLQLHVGRVASSNSDTLMIMHVAADHRSVSVISLPRDSWVEIPGHGMNKINAAFGLGGAKLMVRTVQQDTGLTINTYAEINFLGFVKVVNALGGVDICLPTAVDDPYSGLNMPAGKHHVNGIQALMFARDRHSFALSDFQRIADQQQILSSLMHEAISSGTLTNPGRLSAFLGATLSAIRVDQNLNVTSLADELRTVPPDKVTFTTVPIENMNYTTPTGQSAVLWDSHAASTMFSRIKTDQPVSGKTPAPHRTGTGAGHHRAAPKVKPGDVAVDVWNGTLISGLSAATGRQLATAGFAVNRSGLTWTTHDIARTVIGYPPGRLSWARLLHKALPGAELQQVSSLRRLRVILGASGSTVSSLPGSSPSPSPIAAPGSPGSSRTAAQAACH